jgi:hypothetical protein
MQPMAGERKRLSRAGQVGMLAGHRTGGSCRLVSRKVPNLPIRISRSWSAPHMTPYMVSIGPSFWFMACAATAAEMLFYKEI